jgi:hypothetical protein
MLREMVNNKSWAAAAIIIFIVIIIDIIKKSWHPTMPRSFITINFEQTIN